MRYQLIDLLMTRRVPVAQWKTTSSANNQKSVQIFIYAKKATHYHKAERQHRNRTYNIKVSECPQSTDFYIGRDNILVKEVTDGKLRDTMTAVRENSQETEE